MMKKKMLSENLKETVLVSERGGVHVKKKSVLLLGAPGSGKGTQAKVMGDRYGYQHLATGDILRQQVKDSTELGRKAKTFMDSGGLVPDDLVNEMVYSRLHQLGDQPYLLDGFPRTIPQAEFLASKGIKFDLVVYFKIDLQAVLDRMAGRLTCTSCGASFHSQNNPPRKEMICDHCGKDLIIREDDKPETVTKRFETFLEKTEPLLEYYRKQGIVFEVDAKQEIGRVQELISEKIG